MHYSCAAIGGPYVQDARYQEQYATNKQQQDAIEQWANTQASDHLLPALSIAEEDQAEYSKLIADIDTYVSEMFVKFVTGEKSIDVFESEYVEQLRKMKIDRVIKIQQAALDEFNSR